MGELDRQRMVACIDEASTALVGRLEVMARSQTNLSSAWCIHGCIGLEGFNTSAANIHPRKFCRWECIW